jgi:hypothetical protein
MNSKQRRHGRVFEHEVTLLCRDNERYFEFEARVKHAEGWLQWQTKRKNWTKGRAVYNAQTFKFRNGAIASVFALKWA